ncbi:MAG TPA: hypothetical protein VF490_03990 [Chryseosolibacter sp.]
MTRSDYLVSGIFFFWIVMLALPSCSPRSSAPLSDYRHQASQRPAEIQGSLAFSYDTLISAQGDTLLFREPYKPSTLEKIGFLFSAVFIYWCIDNNSESSR